VRPHDRLLTWLFSIGEGIMHLIAVGATPEESRSWEADNVVDGSRDREDHKSMRGTLSLVKNHRIVAIRRHRYNPHVLATGQTIHPPNCADRSQKTTRVDPPLGIMHGIMLLID
jgi:hypothetical protein